jgi:hypothetical protein
MNFIWTDRGYINPAHIVAIEPHQQGSRITYLIGGDVASAIEPHHHYTELVGIVARTLRPPIVVPAEPGTRVVALSGVNLPVLIASVQPVIAWELYQWGDGELSPTPVLVDDADHWGLITESGSVLGSDGGAYPGVTQYVEAVQAAHAKRHAAAQAARTAKALLG